VEVNAADRSLFMRLYMAAKRLGVNATPAWRRGISMRRGDINTPAADDRRVATRYDKLAANVLAFVKLASIRI
jgi:transposase